MPRLTGWAEYLSPDTLLNCDPQGASDCLCGLSSPLAEDHICFLRRNKNSLKVGAIESCDACTCVSTAEMWWVSSGWLKVSADFLPLPLCPNAHMVATGVPLLQSILWLSQWLQQLSCPLERAQCTTDLFYLLSSFQMHALNPQRLLEITISKWGESKQRKWKSKNVIWTYSKWRALGSIVSPFCSLLVPNTCLRTYFISLLVILRNMVIASHMFSHLLTWGKGWLLVWNLFTAHLALNMCGT